MSIEYRLLKDLPFMDAGIVFKVFDVEAGKKYFCVEQFCKVEPKVFNPYENGILRSIVENCEWVERLGN